jgi:ABC-type glycerol-3-phosphate transport system substrate-binding protein
MNYTYAFAVNKSVMTDAGLDPSPQPATWNDLLALCDSLNAAGVTPIAAGWQDGFYYDWFQFILLNQTVSKDELAQMTRGELPFDSVGFLKAEEYFAELVDRDCFNDDAIGAPLGEVSGIWESGAAAIQLVYFPSSAWAETLGEEGVGFFLLPELDDNRWGAYPTTDAGPNGGWAITSWSKNPDAAWRYISFLLSAESQTIYASFGGSAPNHVKANATSDIAFMNEYFELASIPENHTTYLSMPVSVQAAHERNAISVVNGEIGPAEVVAQLEEERQLVLSE